MDRQVFLRLALSLAVLATLSLAGCGGGGGGGGDAEDDLGDLALIDVNVGGTDGVALNKIVVFEFSERVVSSSVTPETMRVRLSPANAWQVPGTYYVDGNVVEFFPRLPNLPDLSDSGLQPGQTYEILLPGGGGQTNTLTNGDGDRLVETYQVTFATAVTASPNLFIDYDPDPQPHVVAANPKHEALGVPQTLDVELTFSEPIHPATVTTSNFSLTLVERPPGNPLSPVRPIPGQVVLTQNRESVVVRFVPDFPLADHAKYTLEVDRRVTDLVGNDLVPHFSEFTIRDELPVPGEFVLDFESGSEIHMDEDTTIASWNNDVPGALSGIFTAGAGNGSDGDFKPTSNVTLNSDFQQQYQFRTFEVPAGVTVRLTGDYPVELLSLQTMKIDGVIDASGQDGGTGEVNTISWSVPANPGGAGGPGGGDGGDIATNVPSTLVSNYKGNQGSDGEAGYGTSGTGGGAATWGAAYNYKYGSAAGGGGGHATAGKAGKDGAYAYSSSYNGTGGKAGSIGGNADLDPITAGGGGGPGMNMWYYSYPNSCGAGSGGGGGGALTLRCANNIEITGGKVLAEGGDGGPAGSSSYASGGVGGAGAGGAILIRTLKELVCQGATISASGGKGATHTYSYYKGSPGGDGGSGRLQLEDGDGFPALNSTTTSPTSYGRGTFAASGAGTPSIGQTLWINLGIFDPDMIAPGAGDIVAELPKVGHKIDIEVQMTSEDVFDLGNPDETVSSEWVPIEDIETLNGNAYSFLRLRVTFTLADDQEVDDPVPFLDSIRLSFRY